MFHTLQQLFANVRIHSWSIMKSKPRRQGKQLSAVIKNSWKNSPDFVFIWILMSTQPTIFNAKFLAASSWLLRAFMIPCFPSCSYVSKRMSELLFPLFNSPVSNFPFNNNPHWNFSFCYWSTPWLCWFVPSFYSKGQFLLMWVKLPQEKQLWQFFAQLPFCPHSRNLS